jgi:hypothetical protein
VIFFVGAILIELLVSWLTGIAPKLRINDSVNSMAAGMLSQIVK